MSITSPVFTVAVLTKFDVTGVPKSLTLLTAGFPVTFPSILLADGNKYLKVFPLKLIFCPPTKTLSVTLFLGKFC